MNLVSCVIPYYNGGDTIARAIDSVVGNPYCLELIIVSDGSPESLLPNLTQTHQEYLKKGKLRIVQLDSNHGQAAARNIGVSISRGVYLSFLDQDDMYLPGFYEMSVNFLEDNPQLAAVEFGAEFVQDGKIVLDESDPRYFAAINSVPWNIVVRRNVFWACGAFPVGAEFRTKSAGEDIAFKSILKHLYAGTSFSDKFVRHYIRTDSATDRFLKGTKVVDGAIISTNPNADDDNMAQAHETHKKWVIDSLRAERILSLNPGVLTN
jgi:glycosyltransferase involved in cell wall biosynthesis